MVQNLVRGLGRRHEVTVVTSAFDGVEGVREEDGVTVHRIPAFHATERLGIPYPIPVGRRLKAALEAIADVDVLHAHGALYASSIHAARLARRQRKPLVLTEHVGFVQYSSGAVNAVEAAAWWTIGDRVVSTSSALATYNARVQRWLDARYPGARIRFIGNGVDTERFHRRGAAERAQIRGAFGLPEDRPLVLFAARDSEKKNLDAVLEFPRDDYHLVVCGAKRDLKRDSLTDLGVVPYDDMPRLFACVDAMVHASTGEGFPLAVQEALASGVPLALLWDSGYAPLLDSSVVVAAETLDELARAVQSIVTDEALRCRLSVAGRSWAECRWSWDATVGAYEQLYDEVLSSERMSPWQS